MSTDEPGSPRRGSAAEGQRGVVEDSGKQKIERSTGSVRKISSGLFKLPKPVAPVAPEPSRGLRLRTKLAIAMVLAALVPVLIVAAI
ncbi:MAG TPA: hypothetical protein VFQ65_22440, partial [Kofleriaceae bacterium]|nr:hypothetical protein [Kofleriaceae bacterium]